MTITPKSTKIAVIGAGAVGSSTAYACLIRGSANQVALYDIDRERAEAEVLDLAHGSPYFGAGVVYGGGDPHVVEGADVVIITAGAKQKPGQTRLELAEVNVGILETLLPQMRELAPGAVFVLVTNPADVLTHVAHKILDLPRGRVISTGTLLDSSRLRWLVARLAGDLAVSTVHAMIVGEHGDTEFGLWSHASIGPVPLDQWVDDHGKAPFDYMTLAQITDEVRNAAYKVIEGKGATNYAIGLSGSRLAEAILNDEHVILPVSSPLSGQYGLNDISLSLPSLVTRSGVERVLELPLPDNELELLHASADAIRTSIASIGI